MTITGSITIGRVERFALYAYLGRHWSLSVTVWKWAVWTFYDVIGGPHRRWHYANRDYELRREAWD
jgi:hypothetical protein